MSPAREQLAAGVDGGGTRMRAVVMDAQGRERARVVGPGAVVTEGDPGPAAEAVAAVVRKAAGEAGAGLPLDALWAGLAGAGREAARAAAEDALRGLGLARRVQVGTDVEAAFQDAFGAGPGILLLAGTGSVAWARGPDGREARAGGWGQRVGDEGSGWSLGIRAVRAVLQAADGRGPETALRNEVREALGFLPGDDLSDLVPWAAGATKAQVAALAPSVAAAAEAGDAVARRLLDDAAGALVAHVTALRTRVAADVGGGVQVALAGGLLGEGGVLRSRVWAGLEELGLTVRPDPPDAVRGAARRALDLK